MLDAGRVGKIGIEEGSPTAQLLHRRFLQNVADWKAGTPELPQGVFPKHLETIKMQAAFSFFRDPFLPVQPFVRGDIGVGSNHGAQDVQVMDFAEGVLQRAEIFGPLGVPLRQKILHCVTESFDSNS